MVRSLRREHFSISRAAEYFSVSELQAQTGQPRAEFEHVCLKELVDNALDAAESAGRTPEIAVSYRRSGEHLGLSVSDNGDGFPLDVLERILDFGTRTSDKAAYRSPSRGQQGNALKTLVGIPIALGHERSHLVIETQGCRHEITTWLAPSGNVQHSHQITTGDPGLSGTRITVTLPDRDLDWCPRRWAFDYALANPHARLRLQNCDSDEIQQGEFADEQDGKIANLSFEPSADAGWSKFGPTDLTAAQWYSREEFRRLAYLKGEHNPDLTVRGFAREFRAQSRRLSDVCSGLPSRLANLEPIHVDVLHERLCMAKPPRPEILGRIGPDHFHRLLDERYGIVPGRHWYKHQAVTLDGVPFVVECFAAESTREGDNHFLINYSVPFSDPLGSTHLEAGDADGFGLDGFLEALGVVNESRINTCALVHLVLPCLQSLDRGKSRLAMSEAQCEVISKTVAKACKTLRKELEQYRRQRSRARRDAVRELDRLEDEVVRQHLPTKRRAVESILLDVYMQVTENETIYVSARDFYYAVRTPYTEMEVRPSKVGGTALDFNYFSQIIVPNFRRDVHPLEMIDYRARGTLYNPATGEEIEIGDKELREMRLPDWDYNKVLVIEKNGIWDGLKQVGGLEFAKKWDMAIVASQGFTTEAVRKLAAMAYDRGWQIFVWHDADPSGYNIARTLAEETARMPKHRIDVFDLGLNLESAIANGYQSETFTRKSALPETLDLTEFELEKFSGQAHEVGKGKVEWRDCVRCEINSIPIRQRIPYLDAQLAKIDGLLPKIQPPGSALRVEALNAARRLIRDRIVDEIKRRLNLSEIERAAVAAVGLPFSFRADSLEKYVSSALAKNPERNWSGVTNAAARRRQKSRVTAKDIERAVKEAIAGAAEKAKDAHG